jgi:hypothetical protein
MCLILDLVVIRVPSIRSVQLGLRHSLASAVRLELRLWMFA